MARLALPIHSQSGHLLASAHPIFELLTKKEKKSSIQKKEKERKEVTLIYFQVALVIFQSFFWLLLGSFFFLVRPWGQDEERVPNRVRRIAKASTCFGLQRNAGQEDRAVAARQSSRVGR
jgi:hypothetical protein